MSGKSDRELLDMLISELPANRRNYLERYEIRKHSYIEYFNIYNKKVLCFLTHTPQDHFCLLKKKYLDIYTKFCVVFQKMQNNEPFFNCGPESSFFSRDKIIFNRILKIQEKIKYLYSYDKIKKCNNMIDRLKKELFFIYLLDDFQIFINTIAIETTGFTKKFDSSVLRFTRFEIDNCISEEIEIRFMSWYEERLIYFAKKLLIGDKKWVKYQIK